MSLAETPLDTLMVEDPQILFTMAAAMRDGDHLSEASRRAHRLLRLSALQGFVSAQYDLGIMYREGEGCIASRVRALAWFYVASQTDKRSAIQAEALAARLSSRDIKEALRLSQELPHVKALFQAAHHGNDPEAMTELGQMVADEAGLVQDAVLAARWFMRALACHKDHAQAQFRLGLALVAGNGVQVDIVEAMRLFELAAAHGHLEAQYELAQRLEQEAHGAHDAHDASKAQRAIGLYRAAAAQGHAMAQYRLGVLLKSSEGVNFSDFANAVAGPGQGVVFKPQHAPYLVQALRYFMQAAEQGNPDAQYELGLMLAQGFGSTQDFEQAAHWYGQSAQQGNAKAQFNLGFLYAHGQGVKQDYSSACAWYAISERSGYAHAKKSLEIILKKMTPAEIERADWQRDVYFNNLQ